MSVLISQFLLVGENWKNLLPAVHAEGPVARVATSAAFKVLIIALRCYDSRWDVGVGCPSSVHPTTRLQKRAGPHVAILHCFGWECKQLRSILRSSCSRLASAPACLSLQDQCRSAAACSPAPRQMKRVESCPKQSSAWSCNNSAPSSAPK